MTDDVEEVQDAKGVKETAKALLVEHGPRNARGLRASVWVPKSVIHDDSEVNKEGTEGVLVVARWFAEKEGLG